MFAFSALYRRNCKHIERSSLNLHGRTTYTSSKVKETPSPTIKPPRVSHVTKTHATRRIYPQYIWSCKDHPTHPILSSQFDHLHHASTSFQTPGGLNTLRGKKMSLIISFSARHYSCSKPSDRSNIAEGRNGLHCISQVFQNAVLVLQ
jgi:hypothetical protein